ncbi:MAG: TonB-dependent receptor [Sulfuriflexus sp.]|nr:TonB-dependent receptor [Sulfuriflexus sp.]
MNTFKKTLLTSLVCAVVSPVSAADKTLEPIVVTASRTVQTVDEALAPVIVIDREEIERSQAVDIAELLRFHAGLDIARTGGAGSQTSLFTRGTESDHTLILIDGVKFNPGTTGGAAIQNINPEIIERIEIVKGPRSTLYGSEAIGGVINIITRRGKAKGTHANASMAIGEDSTRKFSANVAHGGKVFRAGLGFAVNNTGGFPARRASTAGDNENSNTSINTYFGVKLNNGLDVELSHWQSSGNNSYLNSSLALRDQDFTNSVTALTFKADPSDIWSTTLKLSRLEDDLDQNQNSNTSRTVRNVLDWQNDIELNQHHLVTAGISLSSEDLTSVGFSTYDENTNVNAIFIQDNIQYGNHQLLVAARNTDHEDFGDHATWNLEYGYQATEKLRLLAGVGTAFHAPTGNDRFGSGGKIDLNPETSRNIELGLRYKMNQHHSASVSIFDNKIKDLITFPAPAFTAENVQEARINGLELGYKFAKGPWQARAEAIFQDPKNESNDTLLLRRAKRSLTASVAYTHGSYRIGADILASGDREDFDAFTFSRKDLDAYTTVNLNASYALDKDWRIQARIENLFDEAYDLVDDYTTPGRTALIELRYSPKGF